jgi:molybdopterin-guanine dinucleotide biosynthesis protein A
MRNEDLSIVIQAGGESKRMGESKACVSFLGEPLLMRAINTLLPIADEMIITSNEPETLDFIAPLVCEGKLSIKGDVYEQRGALQGIYSALHHATNEYVAIVACDMIFPSTALLEAEQEVLKLQNADLAIPKTSHGFEPFHAVYRKSTCERACKIAIERGEKKANSWFGDVKTVELDINSLMGFESTKNIFLNVNTKEELHKIEDRLRKQ